METMKLHVDLPVPIHQAMERAIAEAERDFQKITKRQITIDALIEYLRARDFHIEYQTDLHGILPE